MDIYIGLSGFESRFLYEDIKGKIDKLTEYAKRYKTVEINSTFYHIPRQKTVEGWLNRTPDDFKFSIKINKFFTHTKKLKIDEESLLKLKEFVTNTVALGKKLAWYLVQLPPSIRFDKDLLENFLKHLRKICTENGINPKLAVEFRHISWYEEDFKDILEKYNACRVISSATGKWPEVWDDKDSNLYIRLHGNRKMWYSEYTEDEIDEMYSFLLKSSAKSTWIYFDNTASNAAVINSSYLLKKIE